MNPAIENILDRPMSHKLAGWGVVLLLICGVFWFYLYSPKLEQADALNTEIEDLDVQVQNELRLARNLPKFRKEVKELDAKLQTILRELPDKREIPDLLATISNLARDAGLEVGLFKPRPEIIRDFYAEVPVQIILSGTFHQVATFFDEVGQLPRIVNINQIAMKDPKLQNGSTGAVIQTACTATTFRYLDEDERARASGNKKGKGKKRRRR